MIKKNKYSLIVIGGGMTGLSTALTWVINHSVEENPVLLIEKEPKTGGYVTSYERDGFLFDTCQMIPNISDILEYLGIEIDLRKHIKVIDVSTPATYARYSGSPTGSIYDMAPYTNNFCRTRLKMRTPIEGLFQPKFVHRVFGCLLAGMQVNDMILDRKIMDGNARYKP